MPEWVETQQLPEDAVPGAEIFAQLTCLNCHSYLGTGGGFPGAPDLTEEGTRGRGVDWQIAHLECPSCEVPGSPMPPFAALTDEQLRQLAVFLEASKGPGAAASGHGRGYVPIWPSENRAGQGRRGAAYLARYVAD